MPQNTQVSLPLGRRHQETNMWCWAASGEMVMDFLGTNVTQCDQANRRFGYNECCNSPVPSKCVMGGWPEFTKYGYQNARTSNTALTWEQIVDQIDPAPDSSGNKKDPSPIAFSWKWSGGGGHMMVAYGYAVVDGKRYVFIHDPWPPNVGVSKCIPYEEYVSGSNYTHWDDFYDIRKAPTGGETVVGGVGMSVPGQLDAVSAATPFAQQQLGTARGLLFGGAPGAMGNASLGQAFAISSIGLDELQGQSPAAGVSLFDRDATRVVFAVTDDQGVARGEMSLNRTVAGWGAATVGGLDVVQRVNDVLQPGAAATQRSIVWIPALNVQFLCDEQGGRREFVSLVDDAVFRKGARFDGDELYRALVDAARMHDGQPR